MLILCKTNIEVVCIMLDMIFRFIVFNMCRICWSLYQQKIIISIRLPTLPPLPIQCSLSIERKNKNMCIAFQNLQSAHEALAKHTLTNIGLLCIYNWCSKCDSNVISLYLFTLFIIWSTQQQKKETNIYPEKKPASVLVFVRKSWWLRIVNYTYTIHLFLLLFFSNWRTHFWLFLLCHDEQKKVICLCWAVIFSVPSQYDIHPHKSKIHLSWNNKHMKIPVRISNFSI